MDSPPSSAQSRASSDSISSRPETPKRELKYHRAVTKTYGRAKPSDPPSSPDPWSTSFGGVGSGSGPSPRRSRISSAFLDSSPVASLRSPSSSSAEPLTPSRGARALTDRFALAKLGFESSDEDGVDQDVVSLSDRNKNAHISGHEGLLTETDDDEEDQSRESKDALDVGSASSDFGMRTPSKRKRVMVEVVIPASKSPRRRRPCLHSEDEREGALDSRESSPSPPASPSQRAGKRSRMLLTPAPSASTTTTTTLTKSAAASAPGKKTQQATISSFFMTQSAKGTGILKGKVGTISKCGSASASSLSKDTSTKKDCSVNTPPAVKAATNLVNPAPKKLEQLFLAFSKDRTKSSPSKAAAKAVNVPLSRNQLRREDEKSKRYHCPQCGMPYIRGQPEDEQIHDRYHRATVGGIDYPGYKNEVVVARFNDQDFERSVLTQGPTQASGHSASGSLGSSHAGEVSSSRIVVVSMTESVSGASTFEKKKVKEVLEVVNRELGSVEFDPEKLEGCKVFLYISSKKKVVGCVVAERIKQGFEIMANPSMDRIPASPPPSSSLASTTVAKSSTLVTPSTSSLSALSPMSSQSTSTSGSAIFCSTVPQKAICGINRIWVSSMYRRQKIASRLLDVVRDRFIYACQLLPKDLAFSQPTGDGKALARQYLGTETFLVYVE